MKRIMLVILVLFLIYGCNIVPKSAQYQRAEEDLIGSVGAINPIVEEIQVVLNNLGYETGSTDGRMGQKTREGIKEFQESMGLKSTGYIDKLTLTEIEDIRRANEERESEKNYTVEVRSTYSEESEFTPTTIEIQTALKNAGFDPGAIDGKMGPSTRQAIKEFQKTKDLTPDGVVGSKTWAKLSIYLER